jgi:hypothetical protein
MESSIGKVLTDEEVSHILNLTGSFAMKSEKYLFVRKGKLLSIKRYKNLEGKTRMLWKCICGSYICTPMTSKPRNDMCGCDIKLLYEEAVKTFNHKIEEPYEGGLYCTYCSSYRDKLITKNKHTVCVNCHYIKKE